MRHRLLGPCLLGLLLLLPLSVAAQQAGSITGQVFEEVLGGRVRVRVSVSVPVASPVARVRL